MERRIALGSTHCGKCGHYGIAHHWRHVIRAGQKQGIPDEISIGCGHVNHGSKGFLQEVDVCDCTGFEPEREKWQERLI